MPSKPTAPTERQLAYAKSLGITIPENIDAKEMSDLISRTVERDKPSTPRHRSYAEYFGIETTEYVGKKSLFGRIQFQLVHDKRDRDLMAWFAYRVYRNLTNADDNSPISGPSDPIIQQIAETLSSDAKVVKSAQRYSGEELIYFGEWTTPDGSIYTGGSKNTIAYKAADSLIRQKVRPSEMPKGSSGTPLPQIRTATPNRRRRGLLKRIFRLAVWALILIAILPILISLLLNLL